MTKAKIKNYSRANKVGFAALWHGGAYFGNRAGAVLGVFGPEGETRSLQN